MDGAKFQNQMWATILNKSKCVDPQHRALRMHVWSASNQSPRCPDHKIHNPRQVCTKYNHPSKHNYDSLTPILRSELGSLSSIPNQERGHGYDMYGRHEHEQTIPPTLLPSKLS